MIVSAFREGMRGGGRCLSAAATPWYRSALDRVVQVQHPVALDHLVGIVEEHGAGVAAEEAHSFTQHHRGHVHRNLVDESG